MRRYPREVRPASGAAGRLAVGVLAVTTLVVGRTSGPTRGPVELTEAILVNPTTIAFGLPSRNGEPEVARLEETSAQVRVEVVSTVHPEGGDCADSIQVRLQSPLADREVIDLGGSGKMEEPMRQHDMDPVVGSVGIGSTRNTGGSSG